MILETIDIDYSQLDLIMIDGFLRGLKPDPVLKVSEWADQFRILPPAVAEPGPFKTSRTPYLAEIQNKLSVIDPAQELFFKKCSQIGATEAGNNWLGYIIDIAPGAMLYVMPTDTMMKDTSRNRIAKMIESSEVIQRKIKPNRSRDGGNTMMNKEFEGGYVKMVGANSPVGLSSTPARFLYLDEIDRYPLDVGGEGDAIALAKTRTSTFGARKKVFCTSTPTLEGASIISKEFDKTGQRYFHVPCPHCGTMQKLIFEHLIWEKGNYTSVTYQCAHCEEPIQERHKTKMLAAGTWIPDFPENEAKNPHTFGYHLNALYSPLGWYSWEQMARESDEAEEDLPKKIVFMNTKLGLEFKTEGEMPDWQAIFNRREQYQINKPNEKIVFLTAGIDVQKDRLEIEIVGWGKGKQSWSVDYRVLMGNTDTDDAPVWNELDKIINESWEREDGAVLQLHKVAIDTGYNTSVVYNICRRYSQAKVIPIKGRDDLNMVIAPPRSVDTSTSGKKINTMKVWGVGTSMIKTELYGWLKLNERDDGSLPHGYCHFPEYDSYHFKCLTAEKLQRTTNKKGQTVYTWVLPKGKRNEQLDCRVYARAAAAVLNIDRFTDQMWDKFRIEAPVPVKKDSKKSKSKRPSIWD